MKKLLTAVAAIALVGIASAADAGIIIRFGFAPRYRVAHRHHHSQVRSARSEHRPTRRSETKVARTPDDLPLAIKITGNQETANNVMSIYNSQQLAFRNLVGKVKFTTFATVGDFRRLIQWYDAPDGLLGRTTMGNTKLTDGYCLINIIQEGNQNYQHLAATVVHEMTHCIDFHNATSRYNMDYLEEFFKDVNKASKPQLEKDGFGYYASLPQEALAQAVSHYLAPDPTNDYQKWEADFPHLNAAVLDLLHGANVKTKDELVASATQGKPSQPWPVETFTMPSTAASKSDRLTPSYDSDLGL
jgi:hypothetical protein